MNRYFVYCRKSTEEENRQIQSLDTQERLLNDTAIRNNLKIVAIYRESKSAKIANNRPLFSEMIERIKNGEANGILVQHPDRLTRNLGEADTIVNLADAGIIKEIRTPTNSFTSTEDITHIILDLVQATNYSRILSVKVKQGFESKILKGVFPHQAPLGYLNTNLEITPDKIRRSHIQMMFSMVENDFYTTRQVTEAMRQHGLKSRNGVWLSKSRIYGILTNPFYYGDMRIRGKLYPGIHEPLISRKTYDNVQDILNGRGRPRPQKRDFLYSRYLTCASCFCKLTASIKKGKYIYYYCTNGKGICDEHRKYYTESKIDSLLDPHFKHLNFPADVIEKSFELYAQKLESEQKQSNTRIKTNMDEIREIETQEVNLTMKFTEGLVSNSVYQMAIQTLAEKKNRLNNPSDHLKASANPQITLELLEEVKNTVVSGYEMFKSGNFEVRKHLMKSVLWNSLLTNEKMTNIRLKTPYELLKKYPKTAGIEQMRG